MVRYRGNEMQRPKEAPKRLLFVGVQPEMQNNLSANLQPEANAWQLDFCSTAGEAMERHESNPFDLVVSASQLPDHTGIEVFNTLKEETPETVRFLLVGQDEQDRFRGLISPAQQILLAPLDFTLFTKQIKSAFGLRAVIHNPDILKLIGSADRLPPLPRIFQQLSDKLNDPMASLNDVAQILSEDIVLSSKVLRLANSSLFNLREPAKDIAHAVTLLGSNTISSLVLSESMSNTFNCGPENEAFAEELNRHSLAVGALASKILTKWKAGRTMIEQAVFCGIVHDIGKLVLATFAPEKWNDVSNRVDEQIRPDVQIERAALGIGHCEIAAYLLSLWGFPDHQVSAVAFHHEPSRFHDREFQLLCALHLAENCSPTTIHGTEFDHDYLEEWRIRDKDLTKFKTMGTEQQQPEKKGRGLLGFR